MEHLSVRPSLRLLAGLLAALATIIPATLTLASPHEVREGETLSEIAERYGLPVEEIAALNGIANPHHILVGQQLAISGAAPAHATPSSTYTISEGDNLSAIAVRFGTTVAAILERNAIGNPDLIVAGQVLSLPGPTVSVPDPVSREEVEGALRAAAAEFGVDVSLVLAVAWQESGWQQTVISGAGAVGVMQILPSTADWALEMFVPGAQNWESSVRDNARLGVAILGALIDQAGGDLELGLAFYHQGWHNVERFGFFEETTDYIANVRVIRERYR